MRTSEDEIPFIKHEMPYYKAVRFVIKKEGYLVIRIKLYPQAPVLRTKEQGEFAEWEFLNAEE